MAEEKGDPREMQNSVYKDQSEKLSKEWYEGLGIVLGGKINLPEMMEYWITYRLIGIYEQGDVVNRGIDGDYTPGDKRNLEDTDGEQ